MRKITYLKTILFLAFFYVIITSCTNIENTENDNEEDIIKGTGTVVFINLEGGFYSIIEDSGYAYTPINLDQEFRVDGLRVRFEAIILHGLGGIPFPGTRIEIITIEKL